MPDVYSGIDLRICKPAIMKVMAVSYPSAHRDPAEHCQRIPTLLKVAGPSMPTQLTELASCITLVLYNTTAEGRQIENRLLVYKCYN